MKFKEKTKKHERNDHIMKRDKKMICGYLSDWGWIGISEEAAACLTHVNYS